MRTVKRLDNLILNIRKCATFAEACLARGLIRDDEWKKALEEANNFEMPWKLGELFALILVHCNSAMDLLEIGSGKRNIDTDQLVLPLDVISNGDLAEEIFGNVIIDNDWNKMANMAIVAPKTVDVRDLNNRVLNMLPGNETLYKSIDKAENEEKQVLDEYLDEYLNSLSPNGFPLHELRLKKYAIVMLIRNLNIENGLCNGTRMLVEEMR